MKLTFATLLAANSALAFPMVKRQSVIVSSVTSVVEATITQAASSAASGVLSATAVASSAISSAQSAASAIPSSASSAASSVLAAPSSAASSAAPSFYPGYFAFPCPSGSELAYVERQTNVPVALADLQNAVANFTSSALFTISNTTGDNTPGSTRTVMIDSAMANEVLTNYTTNAETGAIYQTWNATSPATINGLTVSSYSTEQQTYINDTETSATAPVSTIKIFSNICASSAAEAQSFFGTFFEGALQNGTTAATAGSSAAPSSALSSASGVASSALSPASAVASSAVSSAVAPITSAASSVASQASAAASSAAGVASSASAAPSAAAGAGGMPMINTPASLVQCQPASIVFSGGQPEYFLSVLPGGQTGATPLVQFAGQPTAQPYVWVVNIAAGTSITLQIRDGSGAINYSSPITIQPSNDASCLAAQPSA